MTGIWPKEQIMLDMAKAHRILVMPGDRIWYGDDVPQDVRAWFEVAYADYKHEYDERQRQRYGALGQRAP